MVCPGVAMPVICTPAMATCSLNGNGADAGHGLHRIVQPCLRIARIVFPGADDADRARADQHRRTAACWSRAMPPT